MFIEAGRGTQAVAAVELSSRVTSAALQPRPASREPRAASVTMLPPPPTNLPPHLLDLTPPPFYPHQQSSFQSQILQVSSVDAKYCRAFDCIPIGGVWE
jgi:hypothetical protein